MTWHRPQRWEALRNREHMFLSDVCRHEMHEQCRSEDGGPRRCEVCSVACMCRCHKRSRDKP